MKPAAYKCEACGGSLQINDDMVMAFCSFCGTKAKLPSVEKLSDGDERLVNAHTLMKLGEAKKAFAAYQMLTEQYPHDYRGWLGMATVVSQRFTCIILKDENYTNEKTRLWIQTVKFQQKLSLTTQTDDYSRTSSADVLKWLQNALETAPQEQVVGINDASMPYIRAYHKILEKANAIQAIDLQLDKLEKERDKCAPAYSSGDKFMEWLSGVLLLVFTGFFVWMIFAGISLGGSAGVVSSLTGGFFLIPCVVAIVCIIRSALKDKAKAKTLDLQIAALKSARSR